MDWDKMKSFHAAAEAGSLTAAGERLGISQSAVSRQIAALEETLGVSLFQRHARGLVLTEAGRTLHQSTSDMSMAAASALSALRDQSKTPQGELVVSAPVAFGSTWLVPRLGAFTNKYPEVQLDLRLTDTETDLLKLEAECSIQLWAAEQADLIQRRLARVQTSLYASKAYLAKAGNPRTPQDLDNHRIIVYGDLKNSPLGNVNWAQRAGRDDKPPREAAIMVNNVFAMMRAVDAGLGIADIPDYMVGSFPELVKVLPHLEGPSFDLYFVYPSDLRTSIRVAAFRDFLTAEVAALQNRQ